MKDSELNANEAAAEQVAAYKYHSMVLERFARQSRDRRPIHEERERASRADEIVTWASLIAAVALVVILLLAGCGGQPDKPRVFEQFCHGMDYRACVQAAPVPCAGGVTGISCEVSQ